MERSVGTLRWLAEASLLEGDPESAMRHLEDALALARSLSDSYNAGWALLTLSQVLDDTGDLDQAEQRVQESIACFERDGHGVVPLTLYVQASIACGRGEYSQARQFIQQALGVNMWFTDDALAVLARIALAEGQTEKAARLHGVLISDLESMGLLHYWERRPGLRKQITAATDRLGQEAYRAAEADGRGMAVDAALAYGLAA